MQRLDSTLLLPLLMPTPRLMSNNLHFKNGGGVRRRNGDYNQLGLVTKEARGARACSVAPRVCGRASEPATVLFTRPFFLPPPPQTTLFCVISICCDKGSSSFSQNGPLQIMSVIPNRGAKADFTPPLHCGLRSNRLLFSPLSFKTSVVEKRRREGGRGGGNALSALGAPSAAMCKINTLARFPQSAAED